MRTDARKVWLTIIVAVATMLVVAAPSLAAQPGQLDSSIQSPALPIVQLPALTSRQNVQNAIQAVVLITVLSLAPAILLMMTSFTRIIIVLSLLRQAIGTQQLPPNQILIGLSMFMTVVVTSEEER